MPFHEIHPPHAQRANMHNATVIVLSPFFVISVPHSRHSRSGHSGDYSRVSSLSRKGSTPRRLSSHSGQHRRSRCNFRRSIPPAEQQPSFLVFTFFMLSSSLTFDTISFYYDFLIVAYCLICHHLTLRHYNNRKVQTTNFFGITSIMRTIYSLSPSERLSVPPKCT